MITAAEWAEWERRTAKDRPDEEALADPLWRIRWLYSVKVGPKWVPFHTVIRKEQIEVLVAIFIRGWRRIIIPKARQLGMSTVLGLICLDQCLHVSGYSAALVDATAADAATKLDEKVEQVFGLLEPEYRGAYTLPKGYAPKGVAWKLGEDAVSLFQADAGFRGGTIHFLWVSEWGAVQAEDAKRSAEILTGTLPAAEGAIQVIETTWKGGRSGEVWTLVEEALRTSADSTDANAWRILFFGWWTCEAYTSEFGEVDEASAELLAKAEAKLGFSFSEGQRRWFAAARRKYKRFIFREYPSTLDDCWHSPVDNAIYGEELEALRVRGRLGVEFSHYGHLPLFTFSDLGIRDTGILILLQPVGTDLHVLDYHAAEGGAAPYWADIIQGWERKYDKLIMRNFLPHDGERRSINDGLSYRETLKKLGVPNTEVIPVSPNTVWWGINLLRDMMPRMVFHTRTAQPWKDATGKERLSLVDALSLYRKKPTLEEPVHDEASHYADAARYIAESFARGLVPTVEKIGRETDGDRKKRRRSMSMNVGG